MNNTVSTQEMTHDVFVIRRRESVAVISECLLVETDHLSFTENVLLAIKLFLFCYKIVNIYD